MRALDRAEESLERLNGPRAKRARQLLSEARAELVGEYEQAQPVALTPPPPGPALIPVDLQALLLAVRAEPRRDARVRLIELASEGSAFTVSQASQLLRELNGYDALRMKAFAALAPRLSDRANGFQLLPLFPASADQELVRRALAGSPIRLERIDEAALTALCEGLSNKFNYDGMHALVEKEAERYWFATSDVARVLEKMSMSYPAMLKTLKTLKPRVLNLDQPQPVQKLVEFSGAWQADVAKVFSLTGEAR